MKMICMPRPYRLIVRSPASAGAVTASMAKTIGMGLG